MAASSRAQASIEFVVKPREDLYLEGSVRTLPRVQKGESYPCQMQKNQNFSCLFRHYAKHNGLKKEDLVFYFIEELQPEDMPETVHLMPFDEIWVEHRKPTLISTQLTPSESAGPAKYMKQFREILESEDHTDVRFLVGAERAQLAAHKVILSARSDYFRAMFRPGGMVESKEGTVEVSEHAPAIFRMMLEYLYTDSVVSIDNPRTEDSDIIQLLVLANEFLLSDLKHICVQAAANKLTEDNIARYSLFCQSFGPEDIHIAELRDFCKSFVRENYSTLKQSSKFRQEIVDSPELALMLVDSLPEPDVPMKRRRLKTAQAGLLATTSSVTSVQPSVENVPMDNLSNQSSSLAAAGASNHLQGHSMVQIWTPGVLL